VPIRSEFRPLLVGGKQEDGRRAGTENVPSVLSMMAALENREQLLTSGAHRERLEWRQRFEEALLKQLPQTQILGYGADRLWNTISVVMPDAGCQARWVVRLDKFGYAVSTGSACASGREEPSHVLAAMGYSNSAAGRALRFSSGWETSAADWDHLLEGILRTLRSFATK
jgi:cysteine desulfurase